MGNENPQVVIILKGVKGDKGDKGDPGAQGVQGAQGVKGDKGDPGAQGVQGAQGVKGDKGDPGLPGIAPEGITGMNGRITDAEKTAASAVATAEQTASNLNDLARVVDETKQQIANIPAGPKGDKGDPGAQGVQGAQGVKGDKGDPGLPGIAPAEITAMNGRITDAEKTAASAVATAEQTASNLNDLARALDEMRQDIAQIKSHIGM